MILAILMATMSIPDWRDRWDDRCGRWVYRFCVGPCLAFDIACMEGPGVTVGMECETTSDYTGDCDAALEDFALYQLRYTPYDVDEYGDLVVP